MTDRRPPVLHTRRFDEKLRNQCWDVQGGRCRCGDPLVEEEAELYLYSRPDLAPAQGDYSHRRRVMALLCLPCTICLSAARHSPERLRILTRLLEEEPVLRSRRIAQNTVTMVTGGETEE